MHIGEPSAGPDAANPRWRLLQSPVLTVWTPHRRTAMPAPDPSQLGPLGGLIGTWEGDQGIDISYHHSEGKVGETPYREHVEFKPFGPVVNGKQDLFGLDYRMAAYRLGEDEPFHTEVGYWLWDGANGQVMRSFMVPRGMVVIAGG